MVRALCLDCSALSISVTQVATVSLVVSASVCVSWYQSLVSMSVRPTHFDPDPVSPPFPTPLSAVVSALVCIVSPNPQIPWYGGGISTIFPGHRCLCLARCVCKFLHGEGDKHTGSHIYRSHHMAACLCKRINSVQLSCLSASRIQSWCSPFFSCCYCEFDFLPHRDWVVLEMTNRRCVRSQWRAACWKIRSNGIRF